MSTEPVGSLAEEAAKLIAALQGWASGRGEPGSPPPAAESDERDDDEAAASSDAARLAAEHEQGTHDPLSAECRYCPLCRLARLAKAATPEVREHLGNAAMSLALAFKSFLDQAAAPS